MSATCDGPIELAVLAGYWLDDEDGADIDAIEEHLLACETCSGRLRGLVALGDGNNNVQIGNLPGVTVDVLALDGNNNITVGNVGKLLVQVGGGNNNISTGNSSPGAQFIGVGGHGNNHITAHNSNTAVIFVAGNGFNVIAAAGNGDTIEVLGNGNNQISDTGSRVQVTLAGDGDNNIDIVTLGGSATDLPEEYAVATPSTQAPFVFMVVIRGTRDDIVPAQYAVPTPVGTVTVVDIEGEDHFDLIDPNSQSWAKVIELLGES